MAVIDGWRSDLDASLETFASLRPQAGDVDPTYSLFAAALLWPVRDAVVDDDLREALRLGSFLLDRWYQP